MLAGVPLPAPAVPVAVEEVGLAVQLVPHPWWLWVPPVAGSDVRLPLRPFNPCCSPFPSRHWRSTSPVIGRPRWVWLCSGVRTEAFSHPRLTTASPLRGHTGRLPGLSVVHLYSLPTCYQQPGLHPLAGAGVVLRVSNLAGASGPDVVTVPLAAALPDCPSARLALAALWGLGAYVPSPLTRQRLAPTNAGTMPSPAGGYEVRLKC